MTDLKGRLGQAVRAAFVAEGLPEDLGRVSVSDRPDLADFQSNGALAAAKAAKLNPRDIAGRIAERLRTDALFSAVDVAGPGFINLRVAEAALADRVQAIALDDRVGASRTPTPRRVVVDYGGPNVAKPMHVGHLRASIIGESIKRLFRFRGDEVWGDAHFGDWGFQMGLLIVAVGDEGLAAPYLGEGPYPGESPVTLEDLERLYPSAAARAKSDTDYRDRARRATAELQNGRPGYRALWRHFVIVSRGALQREFHALGVDFDLWKGESDVDGLIPEMIDDLKVKGLLVEDHGAQIVRVTREGDKRDVPPLLVVSSEGSSMYGTTDLATVLDRRRSLNPDLVLYVVDQRQRDHFEQVFRAAALAGYAAEPTLEHIGFGTMNGTDGKPFKTREGGVLKLDELIRMVTAKAQDRLNEAGLGGELDPAEFKDTAHKVAVAALKFADLGNFRGTSYIFDLDRFMSFEGKTGPYLLYQAVRIKSLVRKANALGRLASKEDIHLEDPTERQLGLTLDAFEQAIEEAYERRAPNLLAEHSFNLAQGFSRFYAACPILTGEPSAQSRSRLALAQTTLAQLEQTLRLLGIETPDRM